MVNNNVADDVVVSTYSADMANNMVMMMW
jgi:hypothetical protein